MQIFGGAKDICPHFPKLARKNSIMKMTSKKRLHFISLWAHFFESKHFMFSPKLPLTCPKKLLQNKHDFQKQTKASALWLTHFAQFEQILRDSARFSPNEIFGWKSKVTQSKKSKWNLKSKVTPASYTSVIIRTPATSHVSNIHRCHSNVRHDGKTPNKFNNLRNNITKCTVQTATTWIPAQRYLQYMQ